MSLAPSFRDLFGGGRPPPCPRGMSASEFEAYQLFVLAEAGFERLRLRADGGPDVPRECRRADGVVMTIDDAMRLAPIPHDLGPGHRCRCAYLPYR